MRTPSRTLLAAPLLLLCACLAHAPVQAPSAPEPQAPTPPWLASKARFAQDAAAPEDVVLETRGTGAGGAGTAPAPTPADDRERARMVHRSARLHLRVGDPAAAADAIAEVADALDGRVETLRPEEVAIRVPVARFDEAIARVEALGEVRTRSIRAEDVTERFQAVELRLRTARATLARLQELLARAGDADTRLRLLAEIQRLTEEIAVMEARSRTLAALAALARIAVTLEPRRPPPARVTAHAVRELAWVAALSPLDTGLDAPSRPLRLAVPEGMVALGARGPLHAEGAGGARFWTHRLENRPEGDADWWAATLREAVAEGYAVVASEEVGEWRLLRLESGQAPPWSWWIAVRVQGGRIDLAQAFFPDPDQAERLGPAVRRVLAGGEETS